MEFQSLLHQGISLLGTAHQSAAERVVLFQSLLHQGISLLEYQKGTVLADGRVSVSIPSSSGHQFTEGVIRANSFTRLSGFQSLLHQGISLLLSLFIRIGVARSAVSIPSSSGHQFTVCSVFFLRVGRGASFNPFFIRASVYCEPEDADIKWQDLVSIPSSSGHQFTVW